MAIRRGVIGTITQSMDGITFSNWKGLNVMKRQVPANNTSNSPAQQEQRRKFAALAVLAGSLGPQLRIGFRMEATDKTEQNVFSSKNKMAVSYNGSDAVVDYAALVISSGAVGGVAGLEVKYNSANGKYTISTDNNTNSGDALADDLLYGSVVDKATGRAFNFYSIKERSTTNDIELQGEPGLVAANLQAYAYFKRAKTTATSPSGTVQVTA